MSTIKYVQEMIAQKNDPYPFYATIHDVPHAVTDVDHWPYSRYFRGVYNNPNPVVWEREAGYRPQQNACYQISTPPVPHRYPNHCFEGPCSSVSICYPELIKYYADKNELDVLLNKSCVTQYR